MTREQTRFAAFFVFLGMGMVLLTHLVRPILFEPLPWASFLFGVLPNFGAGLGLPFEIMVLMVKVLQSREQSFKLLRVFLLSSAISLVGLSVWEFTGGTIDVFDLLATFTGNACAIFAFLVLPSNKKQVTGV